MTITTDAEAPRATVREALHAAADPALRAWIGANARALDAALQVVGPFMLYSDADFEVLDALLTQEVIDAAVEYSRTLDWNNTTRAEAKRASERMNHARTLVTFMTYDNDFRISFRGVDEIAGFGGDILTPANGFEPHNARSLATLRAELQAKLPGAIARARGLR